MIRVETDSGAVKMDYDKDKKLIIAYLPAVKVLYLRPYQAETLIDALQLLLAEHAGNR